MPLTKESLRQLVRLQEQDKIVDALQVEIDKIPKIIADIQARIEGRKSRLTDIKGRANAVQLKKKEKEAAMSAKEAEIKKHGQELNQVKTNEAFRALQTEIEKGKADVGDFETEILTAMDELDQLAKEEKVASAELKAEEGKDQQEIQAFQKDKEGLEAKAAGERQKREGLVGSIPEDVLKIYEHLRKRKQGVALAPVLKNLCGGCRIMLPPQVVVEVVKAVKLQTCEGCLRILHMPETPAAAATTADAK